MNTHTLRILLRRLEDLSLPTSTLERWVKLGLVSPSVHRSRVRGLSHRWSAADVALVAWLVRRRADGADIVRYQGSLKPSWGRLTQALQREADAYIVAVGDDAVLVMSRAEVIGRLQDHARETLIVRAATSLAEVRAAARDLGVETLP